MPVYTHINKNRASISKYNLLNMLSNNQQINERIYGELSHERQILNTEIFCDICLERDYEKLIRFLRSPSRLVLCKRCYIEENMDEEYKPYNPNHIQY